MANSSLMRHFRPDVEARIDAFCAANGGGRSAILDLVWEPGGVSDDVGYVPLCTLTYWLWDRALMLLGWAPCSHTCRVRGRTSKGESKLTQSPEGLTDEAIHIAAGMLLVGYGGVIGTMWSISDELAPVVARGVYEQVFRDGGGPDYREAARALHGTIGRLQGGASFATWLPSIHVGL